MNKKDLQALGIEDEDLIQSIIVLHGKDIEKLKATNDSTASELATMKAQFEEASNTIAGFKELDIEGVKQSAEEWRVKAEKAQAEAQAKIREVMLDSALKGKGARNLKSVKALLDLDKITLNEDNSLAGLDEQIGALMEENDFLFEPEEPAPTIVKGSSGSQTVVGDAMVAAAREAAGLKTR